MQFTINNKAVSQVVGFVLSFAIISLITSSAIYTVSSLAETRVEYASEITSEALVNYVTNSIIECSATRRACPNANYSKIIEVPTKINNKNYYIEATNSWIFLNTTDGKIQVKSSTYKQDLFDTNIRGKVYGSSGLITIYNVGSDIFIIE